MHLSVILPTYNRVDRLKKVLSALDAQDLSKDHFEVIVVSDGSTDGTNEYLKSFSPGYCFKALFQANQGPAAARNLGLTEARGDFVLFIDDDVLPTARLLSEHLRIQTAATSPTVVFGPMLSPSDFNLSPWVAWEQAMLARQYRNLQSGYWQANARMFYTGNASLPRQPVIDSGGFDINFRRAEDVELGYRLAREGLQFKFAPAAVGYHYAERNFSSWMNAAYLYGLYDVVIGYTKYQQALLAALLSEFWSRNILVRLLVSTSCAYPRLYNLYFAGLRALASFAWRSHQAKLAHMVCSGLFNLAYYRGMADEFARRSMRLWDELAKHKPGR